MALPMAKFALLEFHAHLFSEHPQLSPDTYLSPASPSSRGDRSCPTLKKPHTPTLPSSATSPTSVLYRQEEKQVSRKVLAIK